MPQRSFGPPLSGAATRGLPVKVIAALTKSGGYSIISRSDIASVKDLKGKRIAINTFGSSADFAIYQLLRRNGLDPNKDVTLLSIAGSPDARFAALIGGSADATVVNSPFEYRAEQMGFKILLGAKETAEYVIIPTSGLSTSQRKIDREPDEIVRMLRALRNAIIHPVQAPILLGLLFAQTGLAIPAVLDRPIALLGQAFSPVALMLVGITLALTPVGRHWRPALLHASIKNLVHPALVAALGLAFGLRGLPLAVMVVAASLPIGANVFLFAQRYRSSEGLITASVVVSTVMALVSVSAVMALANRF